MNTTTSVIARALPVAAQVLLPSAPRKPAFAIPPQVAAQGSMVGLHQHQGGAQ